LVLAFECVWPKNAQKGTGVSKMAFYDQRENNTSVQNQEFHLGNRSDSNLTKSIENMKNMFEKRHSFDKININFRGRKVKKIRSQIEIR
jgi:hypothetical protein